ncbi:Hpt domain-containing protein [Alkalilimnicola ehrlichii]|uniref:Hpt domain-containing protein n=1 Tax=Alkalilimnicola ehrlichii TaxID=351052 RepID=UPI0026C17566|nr:Hpt domain-containing protein [Alkalilimnicola ehrlichii]
MGIDIEDDIVQDFLVESREILESLSEQLVDLEQRPGDRELLNAVFRGFHTIKGGAGFLNFEPLVDVCHQTEDIFNLLRSGDKTVTADLMDTVLEALDVVTGMFGQLDNGEDLSPASAELIARLKAHNVPDSAAPAAAAGDTASADTDVPAENDPAEEEFEALLQSVGEDSGTASSNGTSETGNDDITEEEFDRLLDSLHGSGAPKGPAPAASGEKTKKAEETSSGADDDKISEAEFDQLLDTLHGKGKGPKGADEPKPVPASKQASPEPAQATPAKAEAPKRQKPPKATPRSESIPPSSTTS